MFLEMRLTALATCGKLQRSAFLARSSAARVSNLSAHEVSSLHTTPSSLALGEHAMHHRRASDTEPLVFQQNSPVEILLTTLDRKSNRRFSARV